MVEMVAPVSRVILTLLFLQPLIALTTAVGIEAMVGGFSVVWSSSDDDVAMRLLEIET